jgi:hypothetical protein
MPFRGKAVGQMRIAVIIPTYSAHLKYLPETLQSIKAQTRQPDLVILAASSIEVGSAASAELDALARTWSSQLPLRILQTAAIQPAGKNRNDGVAAAVEAGMDLLSFFDSDDIMAPRRLELVEQVFLEHGNAVSAVVHSHFHGYTRHMIEWPACPEEPDVLLGGEELKAEPIYSVYERSVVPFSRPVLVGADGEELKCHMAHLTARTECFKTVQFDVRPTYYEDAQLLGDLMYHGYPVAHINAVLSMYYCVPESVKQEERKDL